MSTVLPEAPDSQFTSGEWIDRAAEVLKTILPVLDPANPLAIEVADLLSEIGADVTEHSDPGDETDEPGDTLEDRFANVLELLRMVIAHASPTGEVANALTDLIDTYSEQVDADKLAGARVYADRLDAAGWPS